MDATVTSLSQARCSLTTLAYEKLEELIVTLKLKTQVIAKIIYSS